MVLSSSVTNAAPSLDWADDTDDEIDFGAPVFSDDEDIAISVRESADTAVSTSSTSVGDYSTRGSSAVHDSGPRRHPAHHHAPYRESPSSSNNNNYGRAYNSNQQYGRSFEKENHWKSGGRRDRTDGASTPTGSNPRWGGSRDDSDPGSRSTRPVIPLPPKPAATLAANHSPQLSQSRSRSPSYRALSPHSGFDRARESTFNNNRSLSPHAASPLSDLSTRSFSPSRTYMDQVTNTKAHSRHRSKDSSQEGRWGKVPHEDKPYPTLHPSAASGSPKDDTVYFRRRNNQPSEPDPQKHHDRTNVKTMYHERLEVNNNWNRGPARNKESNERWGKAATTEPGLPYPERPSAKVHRHHNNSNSSSSSIDNNNSSKIKGHSRSRSRGQAELAPVAPSPSFEKTNPRGTRGKGKDQHKQKSKSQAVVTEDDKDSDAGAKVPWWEDATYGAKSNKKEDTVKEDTVKEDTVKKDTVKKDTVKKDTVKKDTVKEPKKVEPGTASRPTKTTKDIKEPSESASEAKEELPWWDPSKCKLAPKQNSVAQVSSQLADMDLQKTKGSEPSSLKPVDRGKTDADIMSRRKALGQQMPISGVEGLTLVSRGGDDSGSSHSLKTRSVQEQVFAEIRAMIATYEERYGAENVDPIPARTRQADVMDRIMESFRKLREGLFASEARDSFAVHGEQKKLKDAMTTTRKRLYEQSILCSLRAGNIPELTKALHHLVKELHPAVYKMQWTTDPSVLTGMPLERQRFLALYILHHIAKPVRTSASSSSRTQDPLTQTIIYPKTEADQLVLSLLHLYEVRGSISSGLHLGPDLIFALAYWKSLREGNWVQRERLLNPSKDHETGKGTLPWEQRLMVHFSMGDALGSARAISVATMSKAYYSLPVSVMAHAVGLAPLDKTVSRSCTESEETDQWVKDLQSSFGLAPTVVVRENQLMFKAKTRG
ncbi:hypothetical protein BG011_007830 [Mortierella polycephala]|uniref:Uncharacterized protein n=1 Tax=Mortierella polycephala TaxID=41804 RepID=A0A9P6PRE5_9FUNG|nr:hypothetical protein BG011_007830 [Mortierella polycephala]